MILQSKCCQCPRKREKTTRQPQQPVRAKAVPELQFTERFPTHKEPDRRTLVLREDVYGKCLRGWETWSPLLWRLAGRRCNNRSTSVGGIGLAGNGSTVGMMDKSLQQKTCEDQMVGVGE